MGSAAPRNTTRTCQCVLLTAQLLCNVFIQQLQTIRRARNRSLQKFAKVVVCPGSSGVFGFGVGFVLLSPLQMQSRDRWGQAVLPTELPSEDASSLSHFDGLNSITWNLMM